MITKVIAGFVGGVLAFMLSSWVLGYDAPVVQTDVEILNEPVEPGNIVSIKVSVYRYRSCSSKIDRMLLDAMHNRVILDDLNFSSAPGKMGADSYIIPIFVPENFVSGRAVYRTTAEYVCNPLQRWWPIKTPSRDIVFTVSRAGR